MKYQLKTITPVHIGTGETLSQIDGFYGNGRWHRIDIDAVLAATPESGLNRLTIAMGKRDFQWSRHLPKNRPSTLYTLPCPEAPRETEIREAIKHPSNRPMIPGSSIKGAIRTALLWDLIGDDNEELQNDLKAQLRRKPDRSWAGRPIEQRVLGKDPNHDLMRAVQVSDTAPISIEALEMGVAWTVTLNQNDRLVQKRERGREYKTCVEQVRAGQTFDFSIKIDKWLFRQREKRELGYSDLQERVVCEELAEVCKFVAKDLAETEVGFFDKYYLDEITDFYDVLVQRIDNLPNGAFILPIGWGTGYRAKTVTELLAQDDDLMDIRKHYGLGKSRSGGDYYGEEFPKTRRVLYDGPRPQYPLGWVQITPQG